MSILRRLRPRAIRDVDSGARSQAISILAIGSMAGLIFGSALGFLLFRWPLLVGAVVFGVPFMLGIWGLTEFVVRGAGGMAGQLYAPTALPCDAPRICIRAIDWETGPGRN